MTRRHDAEPRKTPRQGRSRATVERILVAAARIFDERGYRGTTTNHVAEAAGVSIGSLYQYFPNKDALLVGLAERHVEESASALRLRLEALAAAAPPISGVVRSLVELAVELNDSSALHAVIHAEAPRTPALRDRVESLGTQIVEAVAAHLVRTGSGGRDPVRRAQLLVAAVDAAVHDVVLRAPRGPARRAATDDLVDLVLSGVSGPPTNDPPRP